MSSDSLTPDQITAWIVKLPLVRPITSAATELHHRRVIVVRFRSQDAVGWGEAAPVPGHTTETVDQAWRWLTNSAPTTGLHMPNHSMGMLAAAFAQAEADLAAHAAAEPLWRHLGGSAPVWASAAIGLDKGHRPDADQLRSAAQQGYRHMKMKIDSYSKISDVAATMAEYPDVTFGVDANGSLNLSNRVLFGHLDDLGLTYIEQPGAADDHEGHRRLRANMSTPIALDETAESVAAIDRILAEESADVINLKAGRFGTVQTLHLASRITAAGCRVRLGGLVESGIGRAHTVALATHEAFAMVGDIAGSDRYFGDDLVRPQWRVVGGRLNPPDTPGIGVAVDEAAVESFATEVVSVD